MTNIHVYIHLWKKNICAGLAYTRGAAGEWVITDESTDFDEMEQYFCKDQTFRICATRLVHQFKYEMVKKKLSNRNGKNLYGFGNWRIWDWWNIGCVALLVYSFYASSVV